MGWGGRFLNPIMKHRDYCGDITNHMSIISIEPASEDAIEAYNEDFNRELLYEELTSVGDDTSQQEWIVSVDWIHEGRGGGAEYTYRYFAPVAEELSQKAKEYIEGSNADPNYVPDPIEMAERIHDYHSKKESG